MLYHLNSTILPLQINFNPLMITFCLFLRAIADIVKQSGEESDKIADYCLV